MFHDPTIVGSWPALAARLDDDAVLARWAETEPALAGLTTVADLLAVWSEDGGTTAPTSSLPRSSGWPLSTVAATTTRCC